MYNINRRRDLLVAWLRERPDVTWTAGEIAEGSGIYIGHGRADRCFDDLKAIERHGNVTRHPGRPARWSARQQVGGFSSTTMPERAA